MATSSADAEVPPDVVQDQAMIADGNACADSCGAQLCGPPGRVWLRADYLMWWTSGMNLPTLVTTGTANDPLAIVLYGNETVNTDGQSGYRTTVGAWLDACHTWGVEFDYLDLGQQSDNFSRTSFGDPILVRPFFDVPDNMNSGLFIANASNGGDIAIEATDHFQSAGALLSYNLCATQPCGDLCGDACATTCSPGLPRCRRTDLLGGFRYYRLSDHVGIHTDATYTVSERNVTLETRDDFFADNDFYGAEIGMRSQSYRGRWSLELLAKIAVGNNHQQVRISGQTASNLGSIAAGVLAGPSNSDVYQRDVFTMIPQLGMELGYQVNCHWRAMVGYNILYWGAVARSADQIDLNADPRNIPAIFNYNPAIATPFPAYPDKTASYWAHGINLGLERRF